MILVDRLTKGTYNLSIIATVIWDSNPQAKAQFTDEIELVNKLGGEPNFTNKMQLIGLYEYSRMEKRRKAKEIDAKTNVRNQLQVIMYKPEK